MGAITESDVLLATTSNAIIIGFNVRPERKAQAIAEQEKVDIRLHTIIYELSDEIKKAMTGMLDPVFKEVYKGRAEVRDVFRITKVGTVAGCMVNDGVIARNTRSACCATTSWSTPARSSRSSASRTMPAKSRLASSAVSRSPTTTTSSPATSSKRSSPSATIPPPSRKASVPSVGVITFELRAGRIAFAQRQTPLGQRPEGPSALALQRRRRGDRLPGNWQRGLVAAVTVSPDRPYAEKVLQARSTKPHRCSVLCWWA